MAHFLNIRFFKYGIFIIAKNITDVIANSGTIKTALKQTEYNKDFPSKTLPKIDHCSKFVNIKYPLKT